MGDANRFDESAATWDDQPRRVKMAQDVAAAIAGRVALSRDLDVLDFGCGTGLLTLALRPLVRSVTGVDTSRGMLDVLRAKLLDRGLSGVETVLLEPDGPPSLPPGPFDLVVSSMTAHHVRDLAPLFREFRLRLRPRGRVALADLDREDGTFHDDPDGVIHLGFARDEVTSLLRDAGFDDLAVATAAVVHKNDREYPIFLVTGTRRD